MRQKKPPIIKSNGRIHIVDIGASLHMTTGRKAHPATK